MKNTETSRISQKGLKIIRALGMFGVALLFCVITTASSSWLSSERVFAVGGIPYIVNEVTKKDIEDAKKKRDEAKNQAKAASDKIAQLEDQRDDLQGELAKLNQASEEQRAQYEIIYGQLQAALEEKAKALDEFIQAQENLEYQQQLFTDRITIMFEYQKKSTLEVLLESDSIAGFFTSSQTVTHRLSTCSRSRWTMPNFRHRSSFSMLRTCRQSQMRRKDS